MTPVSLILLGLALLLIRLLYLEAYRRRSAAEYRAQVLEVLAATVRRGLPVGDVLAWAAEEAPRRMRTRVAAIAGRVDGGVPLSEALAGWGADLFPAHAVAAVRAGEGSPLLADALLAAARETTDRRTLAHRVWMLAVYPAVVCAVLAGADGLFGQPMYYVMASMDIDTSAIFSRMGLAGDLALAILVASVLGIVLWTVSSRFPGFAGSRGALTRALTACLPGFRCAARLQGLSRLLAVTGCSVRTGRPLDRALAEAADAAGHRGIRRAASRAAADLAQGADGAAAWDRLPIAAADRARLRAASCGPAARFGDLLAELARETEARRVRLMDRLLGVCSILMTLVLGALVLAYVSGVFQCMGDLLGRMLW